LSTVSGSFAVKEAVVMMNEEDLETADISSRVHNTRPQKQKDYTPIGRNSTGKKKNSNGNHPKEQEYYEEDTIKFYNSDNGGSPDKNKVGKKKQEECREEKNQVFEEVIELSPEEKARKLFDKINKKLSKVFDRDDQAKLIVHLLMKLRQQYALDDEVLSGAYKWGFLSLLLTNSEKIYKFSYLV
jgi:hypothetical protein